jgi:hypothetical protein
VIRARRAILAAATPLVATALAAGCNSGGSGPSGSPDGGGSIADAAGDQSATDAGGDQSASDASGDAAAVECIPDGAGGGSCNPCATLATDPYNVCSAFVGNCIPFDPARVPVHPDL